MNVKHGFTLKNVFSFILSAMLVSLGLLLKLVYFPCFSNTCFESLCENLKACVDFGVSCGQNSNCSLCANVEGFFLLLF